jgi:site-specific DNA recombinase
MKNASEQKEVRCAIYTRKSTTEGMDGDFTSLDNQRESAENYIQSQRSQGWLVSSERYDDGGFTGANTERPALQKLIDHIKEGKIDCVVVYKVDRLSRSLLDFVNLLQFFEESKVTFVSVTQHFNTQTSMGRLTLNILLSFAQFEREIISERTKDKMGNARRKGKWTGGRPPLGYNLDNENHRILVNAEEAETVRTIFDLYIKEKSLLRVANILNERGLRTKTYIRKGKPTGAIAFKNTNIQYILKNVIYLGKTFYGGEIHQGQHEAIVSAEAFKKANEIISANRRERDSSRNTKTHGLFSGIFRCKDCGVAMSHTYARKGDLKYLYYICLNVIKRNRKSCPTKSVSSGKIEAIALDFLRKLFPRDTTIQEKAWTALTQEAQIARIRMLLKEVRYSAKDEILGLILLKDGQLHEFKVALAELKHVRIAKKDEIKKEPKLRQNLALAHQIEELLDNGHISGVKELTGHLNMSHSRINQIMGMALLSPAIQEDILLSDRIEIFRIPEYKLNELVKEADWQKQDAIWQNLLAEYATKSEIPSPA